MRKFALIISFVALVACSKYIGENKTQRYEFCSLESCEDRMNSVVMICPHPDQEAHELLVPDPVYADAMCKKTVYDIDKDNWVVRIKLVRVSKEEDFSVHNSNKMISKMENEYRKQIKPYSVPTNVPLTTAKISSNIVITADCDLFGRPAGVNLADKFIVPYFPKDGSYDEHFLMLYDEHEILADLFAEDSAPMKLTDYFAPGVMVHRGFWLKPSEPFEENPESIQFHIEYDAQTELLAPYADHIGPKYVSKGAERHLYSDFVINLSDNNRLEVWYKDAMYGYPWK